MFRRIAGTLLGFLLCLTYARAQTPYYDALFLKSAKQDSTIVLTPKVVQVLAKYFPGVDTNAFSTNVTDKNPFLVQLFSNPGLAAADSSTASQAQRSFAAFTSQVGNLNVTNVADGIAQFLVERAKEELSIAFFQELQADLNSPALAELKTLFPQTEAVLGLIGTRIYQFSAYLSELRAAFLADLKGLGYTIPIVLNSAKFKPYFKTHPQVRSLIELASQLGQLLSTGTQAVPVGKLIDELDPVHYFSLTDSSSTDSIFNGSVKLLKYISNSFKSGNTSRFWVTTDSAELLISNDTILKLYLGLMYQQGDTIYFGLGKKATLQTLLMPVAADVKKIEGFGKTITGFTNLATEFEAYLAYMKQPQNKDTSNVFYDALCNKTIAVIESGLSLAQSLDPSINGKFLKYVPAVGDLANSYLLLRQQKYSLAILSLVDLFNTIQLDSVDSKFVRRLSTYGAFIAEVAQAQSSSDVKTIIENTVLPVGSASIKKNSRFNIALNAYLGGFYGREYVAGDATKPWAGTAGITAPIGIAFSKPLIFYKNNSQKTAVNLGAITLFASILDVGSFASYRLNDTSTAQLPKVTLQNIFAPGIGGIWGLPKWPVSIGYMYQWGPALRAINAESATVNSGANRRWFIFAAVDIPLLNIFNKPR